MRRIKALFIIFLCLVSSITSTKKESILIKNGLFVTSTQSIQTDLLVQDGKIAGIGQYNANLADTKVIDATGMFVMPGAIDVHTHLDFEFMNSRAVDDFFYGTKAAAMGGTTTVVDHMAFGPKDADLHHQLNVYHKLAGGRAVVDYGFHGVVTTVNDDILSEMPSMMKDGVTSFKGYMTYDYGMKDTEMFQILRKVKEIGGIAQFHCENNQMVGFFKQELINQGKKEPIYHARSRPNLVEADAISRVLKLAKMAGDAPVYIVHLSTKEGLEEIRAARKRGQKNIFVETCPQYLVLTEDRYLLPDGIKYIMSPPLRTQADCDALWGGLADGSIQVVATDHCPFNYGKEKQMGKDNFAICPNGAPGIEERLLLLYTEGVAKGKITLNKLVETLSTNPAKLFGLAPEKGTLTIGSDADVLIYNPNGNKTLKHEMTHGSCDYSAYEGFDIKGKVQYVLSKGKIIVDGDNFLGAEGDGKFIHRKKPDYNL